MPSQTHQALLLWTARKMARDGFRIIGLDGVCEQAGLWNYTPAPPSLFDTRPDVVGININGIYALGEAKTAEDIDCFHTRQQLSVFAELTTHNCRLYVAIPRSAVAALDRVLADLHLVGNKLVVRLHIPDILVMEEEFV